MQNVAIVADSSIDLPPHLLEKLGVVTAPIGYNLGADHYRDGEQELSDLYRRVAQGEHLELTGVDGADFERAFLAAGHSGGEVLCLCQSFGSSSPNFDAASLATRRVAHLHNVSVHVMNTARATAGQAALTIAAARAAQAGWSKEQVEGFVAHVAGTAETYVIAASLDQLARSGQLKRIATQSGLGPLDGATPLFRARDRLVAVAREPDAGAAEEALAERVRRAADGKPLVVVLTNARAPEAVARLRARLEERLDVAECHVTEMGATLVSLLGPGAYGLGFCPAPELKE